MASVWPALPLFLLFCACLVIAGIMLVRSLVVMARYLRIKEFVLAFLLMALSTTLPELFVGISAALAHNSALSLGNVIGSNITDLAFIGGVILLLTRKMRITDRRMIRDAYWLIPLALLPMALMYAGGELSRTDGIVLLCVFAWRTILMIRDGRETGEAIELNDASRVKTLLSPLVLLASVILLIWSADNVVTYATALASAWSLPPILIGLLILALGTSLPELAFGSQTAIAKHPEMGIGDIMGAVMCNSLLVLGVTAVIWPITANMSYFLSSAAFMILACTLFATFMSTKKMTWNYGITLLQLYNVILITELSLRGIIDAVA